MFIACCYQFSLPVSDKKGNDFHMGISHRLWETVTSSWEKRILAAVGNGTLYRYH